MSIPLLCGRSLVIFLMACAFLLVEPVQGYMYGGDISKAGTNIFAFFLFSFLFFLRWGFLSIARY